MAAAALWLALAAAAQAAAPCPLPSASGQMCFGIERQAAPPVGRYAAWNVKVTDRDGRPVDVSLSVRGGMPSHGHGLPSKPTVRRVSPGDFLVEGLLFNMPGEWVVVFDARAGGSAPDSANYRFNVGL